MRIASIGLVVLAGLIFATTGSAAMIENGSFEAGNVSFNTSYQTISSSSTTQIDYWTVESGNLDWISNDYWEAQDGDKSLDLTGTDKGITSQSFSTIEDAIYDVSFWMAGNPDASSNTLEMRVTAVPTSDGAAGTSEDFSFDATSTTKSKMGWVQKFFQFTASGSSTALKFESLTDAGNGGPALDNVSIDQRLSGAAAVPLPGAAWLGLAMMAGLGLIRRSRRRRL